MNLESIGLQLNETIGPDGIKAFAENNPPSLQALEVDATGIGDEGMPLVAALLQRTQIIEYLSIAVNDSTDTAPIADALGTNTSLKDLNMGCNKITDRGIRGFA